MEKKIVITHGTDTMIETAKVLGKSLRGKIVVLTGAMIPYKFGSSDGLFNMGSAMAYVQSMPEGVYVAMNGQIFDWNNCRKDKKSARFRKIR